jgi:predicted transcriptional regulator
LEREQAEPYVATESELKAIDQGLRDAAEGRFATEEEVRAVFAKYRGS